jgi:hypothetical protein
MDIDANVSNWYKTSLIWGLRKHKHFLKGFWEETMRRVLFVILIERSAEESSKERLNQKNKTK